MTVYFLGSSELLAFNKPANKHNLEKQSSPANTKTESSLGQQVTPKETQNNAFVQSSSSLFGTLPNVKEQIVIGQQISTPEVTFGSFPQSNGIFGTTNVTDIMSPKKANSQVSSRYNR